MLCAISSQAPNRCQRQKLCIGVCHWKNDRPMPGLLISIEYTLRTAESAVFRRIDNKACSLRDHRKVKRIILHCPCSRLAVSKMRSSASRVGFLFVHNFFFAQTTGNPMAYDHCHKVCQFSNPNGQWLRIAIA